VLFSLPPGQYCPYPIQAVSAWFVIKTEARRQLPTPAFDDVKLRLTQQLMRAFTVAAVKTAMTDLPQKDYGMTGKDAAVKK
jgi:parvulin-like peptidyl-prolyl isomerase